MKGLSVETHYESQNVRISASVLIMEVYVCPCLQRSLMTSILKDLLFVGRGGVSREGLGLRGSQDRFQVWATSSCTHDSGVCRMPQ